MHDIHYFFFSSLLFVRFGHGGQTEEADAFDEGEVLLCFE